MIEGALIALVSALAGGAFGRYLRFTRHPRNKPVKPICGCKHHFSFHDPKTGECHGLVDGYGTPIRDEKDRPVKDVYGDVQKSYSKVQCSCRHYAGPEPLPSLYANEIAS
jgi:hypothetical protein